MNVRDAVPANGTVFLAAFDLSETVAYIDKQGWEYYPEHLYTPQDFANGTTVAPLYSDSTVRANFGTYRLRLKIPPVELLAVTGRSFLSSHRVFIDGVLVDTMGIPGDTAEQTRPRTKTYQYTFVPQGSSVELIFQAANFHHRDGIRNVSVKLAEPEAINRYRVLETMRTNIIIGCFVAAFLFLLGIFLFFPRRPYLLFFSLLCLATGVRMALIGSKGAMEAFPGMSWFTAMRLEYLCLVAFVALLQMYFATLYPGMLHRFFVRAVVGVSALYGLIILFCDSLLFTGLLKCYTLVWVVASVFTLWKMLPLLRRGEMRTVLIFIGLLFFFGTALFDEAAYLFVDGRRLHNTLISGVLVCVFINMLALTLDFSRTESDLAKARERQRALNASNSLLDRLNNTKTRFLANISHEMKMPLTAMSVHAQLAKALLATGADTGEINQSLDTISDESGRLARLVDRVLDVSSLQESRGAMTPLAVDSLLQKCAEAYRVLIEKKGNSLGVSIPAGLGQVNGNADMLAQVLFNLLSNANRHTANGSIFLTAWRDGKDVMISVRDTGSGIEPELLPHIFERHVRGESGEGTGLGLAICRSIASLHGGTIDIDSVVGMGSEVRITLPVTQGEA